LNAKMPIASFAVLIACQSPAKWALERDVVVTGRKIIKLEATTCVGPDHVAGLLTNDLDLDTFLSKLGAAVDFEGAVKASLATQFVNIVEIGEVLESVLQVLRTPANYRVIHWLSVAVLRFG